jgi:3-methyladenine DNA glycosylase AlkD
MKLTALIKEIQDIACPQRALGSARFFKTNKGEYGEGDLFLGITVPDSRKLAKKYALLDFKGLEKLLDSKWHEERFIGIIILVMQFNRAPDRDTANHIFDFYRDNLKQINNWDLVDVSADKIIGAYTFHYKTKSATKKMLFSMADSSNLWERRIAVIACFYYIRNNDFEFIMLLAKKLLLKDEHDLIHKALGWMLREVGKRDMDVLIKFLDEYKTQMPRTMLRYAIEKISQNERLKILRSSRLRRTS